jgi:hypothetical protein
VSDQSPPGPKPDIPYWHLYTDADGVSRFKRCAMTELDWKALSSSAQWQGRKITAETSIVFSVLPPGWFGDWHENPKPQWIIPLSGRWYVEAMDGQRIEFGPGEAHFGEDQHTTERDSRKGHLSGTVGDAPCVQMIVQFEEPPTRNEPCRFR